MTYQLLTRKVGNVMFKNSLQVKFMSTGSEMLCETLMEQKMSQKFAAKIKLTRKPLRKKKRKSNFFKKIIFCIKYLLFLYCCCIVFGLTLRTGTLIHCTCFLESRKLVHLDAKNGFFIPNLV